MDRIGRPYTLEDYIIHVFCLIDDLYTEFCQTHKVRKSRSKLFLANSKIITMLLVGEFIGIADNKKIWLYFKSNHLDYFSSLSMIRYKVWGKKLESGC